MMRMLTCAVLGWITAACYGAPLEDLQNAPRFRPGRAEQELRVWVDSSGRYQAKAAFVSRDRDSVTLRKFDGAVVRVPVERLSTRDRRYLEQLAAPRADSAADEPAIARPTPSRAGRTPTVQAVPPPTGDPQRRLDGDTLPADLVYVHVSDRTLRRVLSRPVVRWTAVNDTIVGTRVRGTAGTTGAIDLRLVPAHGRAVVDLLFQGQVQSQTTGFGGPVRVHSTGVTQFSAVKRLMLDEHGIEALPARVAAQTSTAIHGVETDLPRIRGWIARRIGSQRAAEMKPAAETEAARKAESRIGGEFDRDVVNELLRANSKLSSVLAALPLDDDVFRGRLQFATSGNYLQLAVHRAEGAPAAVRPPSPATFGAPELVIHVHSSVVDRAVRNTDLQQQIEPLVNMLLANQTPRLVGIVSSEPQIQLKQSADGQWWSLVVRTIQ